MLKIAGAVMALIIAASLSIGASAENTDYKYYLTDGIFSVESEHNVILGLYKNSTLVAFSGSGEIDIDGIEFDTAKVFVWSSLDTMIPEDGKIIMSSEEVLSSPPRYNSPTATPTIVPTAPPTAEPTIAPPTASPTPEPVYESIGGIPSVYLEGDASEMSKQNRVTLRMVYVDGDEKTEGYTSAKWQGNYALYFDKKNYSVKLYKDENLNKKLKIKFKDWDKSNNYVLKANWIDSTAARNIVCARLFASLPNTDLPQNGAKGVVDGFPVRLYLNGEFRGLYTWNKPKKGWVFGMDGDNPDEAVYFANWQTGSGLFERKYSSDRYWELVYPDEHPSDEEFDRVTGFVAECSDEEFREHITEYMDFDSMLNFYILSQIIAHTDGTAKNLNMATYDGKLWYIRPYDMDATFGLEWHGLSLSDYKINMSDIMRLNTLWRKLEDNFPQEIYDRYILLRNNELSEASVLGAFEQFMNEVGEDLYAEDLARWPNQPSRAHTYRQIEDFVNTRYPYLDEYMEKFNIAADSSEE